MALHSTSLRMLVEAHSLTKVKQPVKTCSQPALHILSNMKKTFLLTLILPLLFSVLLLSGCSKPQLDTEGCFTDADSAFKYAAKKDRNVLLLITMEDDDSQSTAFLNGVLRNESFKNEIASEYAVLHFDFSQKTYAQTVVPEGSDAKTQKLADEKASQIQKNTRFVSLLNVSQTPSFFILSKDSYVLSAFFYEEENPTFEGFKNTLQNQRPITDSMEALIKSAKKGSALQKVSAIDALYESTSADYRPLLEDLLESVQKLDKNNESGLLGKYIYAAADAKAIKLVNQGEVSQAVDLYIQAAENPAVASNLKQQSYYIAAYLCAMTGSAGTEVIQDYLQKAIDADPQSEEVSSIKKVMEIISSQVE